MPSRLICTSSYGKITSRSKFACSGGRRDSLQIFGMRPTVNATTNLYYYRARYYDPAGGRFLSEDPLRFRATINNYRYVSNNSVNLMDPMGLYQLKGFTPGDAATMILTINTLKEKLKSSPCCIDPKVRDKILNLLGEYNDGSGVTFTYHPSLPSDPGTLICGQVNAGLYAFLFNRVEISEAAFSNPACGNLASTILHEVNHLTLNNLFSPDPEADSLDAEARCYGTH